MSGIHFTAMIAVIACAAGVTIWATTQFMSKQGLEILFIKAATLALLVRCLNR